MNLPRFVTCCMACPAHPMHMCALPLYCCQCFKGLLCAADSDACFCPHDACCYTCCSLRKRASRAGRAHRLTLRMSSLLIECDSYLAPRWPLGYL